MYEILHESPWLIVVALGVLVPVTGIIFGTVTNYLTTTQRAQIETNLKHEMLNRGMSAEDIRTVITASSDSSKKRKRADCDSGLTR
jgi:hypothetical protein